MPRRSLLFSPGDQPDLVRKAPRADPDVIAIDLEDAVAPDARPAAREAVAAVLTDPEFDPDAEVCVRLGGTPEARDADLAALADADAVPDSVMVPKVADAETVAETADLLSIHGFDCPVLALLETARGVVNAVSVADEPATDALVFGAEDLAADVGATRTDAGTEVLYARQRVVTAAAAAGIDAVDTLYTDFSDEAGLREDTRTAVEFGYDGKMAIHPSQVGPINEAFTPDDDRIAWAERVLAARDRAAAEGRGVFEVDGEMIDAPLIAQAERVRDRALAAGRAFEPGE
ncbi:CoA ester lyase [Halobaculum sp. MBLA0147]|uniref:HpcH/HpaI aldolase/citrate lyase family protein n=1 Tax=Halobaculum sp. MBLA0147 TaxID=3079934 RepID=UPI0035233AF6